MFVAVVIITVVLQALLVEFAGDFAKTSSLDAELWGWSFLFAFLTWPLGMVLRWLIPLEEDPNSFFGYDMPTEMIPLPKGFSGKGITMGLQSQSSSTLSTLTKPASSFFRMLSNAGGGESHRGHSSRTYGYSEDDGIIEDTKTEIEALPPRM